MKSLSLAIAFFAALPMAAAAETTKEDVKKLAKAGVSEDVILSFIRANGPIANLSSDDVVELKAAGVSDRVLSALLAKETPRTTPEVQPETRIVEKKVYVPSTTYVYTYDDCYYPTYNTYSYYPYSSYYYRPSWNCGVYYTRGWRGYYYRTGGCW